MRRTGALCWGSRAGLGSAAGKRMSHFSRPNEEMVAACPEQCTSAVHVALHGDVRRHKPHWQAFHTQLREPMCATCCVANAAPYNACSRQTAKLPGLLSRDLALLSPPHYKKICCFAPQGVSCLEVSVLLFEPPLSSQFPPSGPRLISPAMLQASIVEFK